MKKIYTVHAYRWGDRQLHSYSVGVYSRKHEALIAACEEEKDRGNKYECEVLKWRLNCLKAKENKDESTVMHSKVIKSISGD